MQRQWVTSRKQHFPDATWQMYKRTTETVTVCTRPIQVQVRKKKTAQRRGSGHRVLSRVKKVFTMVASGKEKQSKTQVFFTREVVEGRLGEQTVSVNQTMWFSVSFFL